MNYLSFYTLIIYSLFFFASAPAPRDRNEQQATRQTVSPDFEPSQARLNSEILLRRDLMIGGGDSVGYLVG